MKTTVKLSSIKIPKSYAITIPSEKKVKTKRKKYRKGKLRAITINTDGFLINGYINYLILKENNIEYATVNIVGIKKNDNNNVPESYRNTKTTYIYGKHPNGIIDKEYVWRLPKSKENMYDVLLPGDLIYCSTKNGIAPVIVTRIEKRDSWDTDLKVKVVCSRIIVRNGELLKYDSNDGSTNV